MKELDLLTLSPIPPLHLDARDLYVQPIEVPVEPISYTPLVSPGLELEKLPQKTLLFPLAAPPAYDDNYDRDADGLEADSRTRFIEGDKVFFARSGGQHVQINSGRRTVRRQAELWICWKQGSPGCNPANLPGCSLHNYGLAIDVIRTNEQLIRESLGAHGWEQTVNDEGWHFECTRSPAHSRALDKITELRNGIAGEWANAWFAIQKSAEERDKLGAEFLVRRDNFNRAAQELQKRIDEHNRQATTWENQVNQWKADKQNLDQRIADFNRRADYANALADRIRSMPPGPERDRLYQEWLTLRNQLEAERPQLEAAVADLNRRAQYLEQEGNRLLQQKQALEAEIQRLQAEKNELQKMASRIERLERNIVENRNKMDSLLARIDGGVSNVG